VLLWRILSHIPFWKDFYELTKKKLGEEVHERSDLGNDAVEEPIASPTSMLMFFSVNLLLYLNFFISAYSLVLFEAVASAALRVRITSVQYFFKPDSLRWHTLNFMMRVARSVPKTKMWLSAVVWHFSAISLNINYSQGSRCGKNVFKQYFQAFT